VEVEAPTSAAIASVTPAERSETDRLPSVDFFKAAEGFFDIVGAVASWRPVPCKEMFLINVPDIQGNFPLGERNFSPGYE
jgi:hypothetical protein